MTTLPRSPHRALSRGHWRLALAGLLAASAAQAAQQPLADISDAATLAAADAASRRGYQQVEASARPLDPRLRLSHCSQPLQARINPQAHPLGRVSVNIRCDDASPWSIYVGVQVSATMNVPVLNTSLPRGTVLGASDLSLQTLDITRDDGSLITDTGLLVGKALDRDTPAGRALQHRDVSSPRIIERGQLVTLVAGAGALQVRMQGRANAAAAVGERIMVTNTRSGRRVEGQVAKDGTVRIQ
ncbi:MAG: flagellar basal body P-ring formation chaperone FlgA [Parahaliea sp.]